MSTLTRAEIEKRLKADSPERLIITPLLTARQLGDVSIDLRLGNQFVVFRNHTSGTMNPLLGSKEALRNVQSRHIVRFHEKFVLHPGALALGATFEYLQMPLDIEGQVEGRSSWARVGLQIASASCVEPGFSGVVTLELSNLGTMPLELYPGIRVAQLILRQTTSSIAGSYVNPRKYRCPVGPQFSRLYSDKDAKVFLPE
jgi:dCTP deaminase